MIPVITAETTAPFLSVLVRDEQGDLCLVINADVMADRLRAAARHP